MNRLTKTIEMGTRNPKKHEPLVVSSNPLPTAWGNLRNYHSRVPETRFRHAPTCPPCAATRWPRSAPRRSVRQAAGGFNGRACRWFRAWRRHGTRCVSDRLLSRAAKRVVCPSFRRPVKIVPVAGGVQRFCGHVCMATSDTGAGPRSHAPCHGIARSRVERAPAPSLCFQPTCLEPTVLQPTNFPQPNRGVLHDPVFPP